MSRHRSLIAVIAGPNSRPRAEDTMDFFPFRDIFSERWGHELLFQENIIIRPINALQMF